MNVYSLVALVFGWAMVGHTKATVAFHGASFTLPLLWLVVAGVVLALAAAVLFLVRAIARDGGWWLAASPAGAP
jgi:hypothetical protein